MSIPLGTTDVLIEEIIKLPLETISFVPKDVASTSVNGEAASTVGCNEADAFTSVNFQLPNGDSYAGTLLEHMPEGSGRYTWADGCTYTGEWRRGLRNGNGKISWPSGSWYDGEFSGGYIHGKGKYMGPKGMSYTGRWKLNLKHGLGDQSFSNGDIFEGSWIQGVIEGPGKYTWANGDLYIGNMKGGKMSGKGSLVWKNGDEYEGSWFDGTMHGLGVYTWNAGGSYVGTWTRGLKDGKGAFYPKNSRLPAVQELYINALRKRGLLPDLKRKAQGSRILRAPALDIRDIKIETEGSNTGSMSADSDVKDSLVSFEQSRNQNFSLERRWSLEVAIEKSLSNDRSNDYEETLADDDHRKLCNIDGPILEREYMQGVLISEVVVNNKFSPTSSKRERRRRKKLAKEIKRPGETIIKGHRSYDLMLSLQLGIRYTVGKITPIQRRDVRTSDFGQRASFWMNFPKEGSQLTPSHHAEDFRWKDYCPMVFRNLRELFKIDAADYMMSICGSAALRELSSPGKSGSVFFLSQDDRFMIKTLRKSEVKVLLRMLPDYHRHVQRYEDTLITKFFGLHRVKPFSGQKFRFVVMGNMFCTELRIHRRFDLKGSSQGRSSDKVEIDEHTTLKDLDLDFCFYLEPCWRELLIKQIKLDSEFLKDQRIMDYSILLGVHYRAPPHLQSQTSLQRTTTLEKLTSLAEEDVVDDETAHPAGLVLVPRESEEIVVVGPHMRGSLLPSSTVGKVDLLLPGTARLQIQLGVNMPARAEYVPIEATENTLFHEVYDVVLYLGIIDILQEYDMKKKVEHAFKSIQFDSLSISAVDPTCYSKRFLSFIKNVFPENR